MTPEQKLKRNAYYTANKGKISVKNRLLYAVKGEAIKARERKRKRQLRVDVLALYKGKCACCGESQPMFLDLDHINNNGSLHRRSKKGRKRDNRIAYTDALKNPKLYQLLCCNCNCGKHRNCGVCPHKN